MKEWPYIIHQMDEKKFKNTMKYKMKIMKTKIFSNANSSILNILVKNTKN